MIIFIERLLNITKRGKTMVILFFIVLLILLAIIYYELRVATSRLPKDVFRYYHFKQEKFMGRDIFIISDSKQEFEQNDDDVEENDSDADKKEKHKVILYLHGGSYVGELEKYHWHFFKDIINDTNATLIVPDYPLAPEHTYLEVFKFMEPFYKEIVEKIGKNTQFILMGDSAGAGLALALYQRNGKLKNRLPDKTILISPWLDVRMENPEIDTIKDPVLKKPLLKLSGKKYAGKNGLKSYLVNPVLGPTDKLKNIYMLSGTQDMLNPDAKKFALANKGKVQFIEYEDAIHNFVLMKHKKKNIHAKDGYEKVVEIILE